MWDKKSHNFNTVKYNNQSLSADFYYQGDKRITGFTPSCHCLTIKQIENKVTVEWKLKDPLNKPYDSRKYVTVHYSDGDNDELKLTANIC